MVLGLILSAAQFKKKSIIPNYLKKTGSYSKSYCSVLKLQLKKGINIVHKAENPYPIRLVVSCYGNQR